jgi:hypothetical protein
VPRCYVPISERYRPISPRYRVITARYESIGGNQDAISRRYDSISRRYTAISRRESPGAPMSLIGHQYHARSATHRSATFQSDVAQVVHASGCAESAAADAKSHVE